MAEAATNGQIHVGFHRHIGLNLYHAKITPRSPGESRTADVNFAKLPGVKMGTPSAGSAPKKLRLLRIETKSVRSHLLCDPLDAQLQCSIHHHYSLLRRHLAVVQWLQIQH